MAALSRQIEEAERRAKTTQDARKSRPLSSLQTPSFNMPGTGGGLLRKAMNFVVGDKTTGDKTTGDKTTSDKTSGDKTTIVERNEVDVLKEAAAVVARRRGLQVEVVVEGLMTLLGSEGVERAPPENPFDDPVVRSVDSEGFQHVQHVRHVQHVQHVRHVQHVQHVQHAQHGSSGASQGPSPGLMCVAESGGLSQVASRVDARPPRQCTSMNGTWAGMRDTNEEERRSSRCSVLTAIREPSTEMVASSRKGQGRGWMERLSGAKAAGARAKRD
jgi:hypothetical protein